MYFIQNVFLSLYSLNGNKFHLPNSSDLSVVAIKHKGKESFCTAVALLFCILQKYYLSSSCTFLYNISGSKRYYDWCRSCLTSLRVSHLDITDCRKFKCPSLGVHANGMRPNSDSRKSATWVKMLKGQTHSMV